MKDSIPDTADECEALQAGGKVSLEHNEAYLGISGKPSTQQLPSNEATRFGPLSCCEIVVGQMGVRVVAQPRLP